MNASALDTPRGRALLALLAEWNRRTILAHAADVVAARFEGPRFVDFVASQFGADVILYACSALVRGITPAAPPTLQGAGSKLEPHQVAQREAWRRVEAILSAPDEPSVAAFRAAQDTGALVTAALALFPESSPMAESVR